MIKYRNTRSDLIFDIFIYTFLTFMLLIVAYPLYFIVIASISEPNLVNAGEVILIPKGINFGGYGLIFQDIRIWRGYLNTINYSIGFTLISVIMSLVTGYALSCYNLVGRRFFNAFFIITMYFGGGLIPTYLLVKDLGLISKFYTMWILGSLVVFHVILARTFFETTIPQELNDAASVDGCNQAQFFFRMVLPLSKPIIAVLALYCVVGQWNSFFTALIYLSDSKLYPLQLVLRDILIVAQMLENKTANITIESVNELAQREKLADLVKYGVIIVSSAPLLIVYPFIQKYFVQGVMIGAVKG